MTQDYLFEPAPSHKLAQLSKEELIQFVQAQERVIAAQKSTIRWQAAMNEELKQKVLFVDDQYIVLKNKVFGKSSEREKRKDGSEDSDKNPRYKKTKVQLPSERYPDAPLIERHVELQTLPTCGCCGNQMHDTGMTEDAEYLTVVPQQFIVVRQFRHKYGCDKCHGQIKTAPAPKRITPGSSMSDEMVLDVGLSKYCDLIPIERYAAIAGREGLSGELPRQSLIESTHNLADFVSPAYSKVKADVLSARVLHADETPHRMLEGDKKSGWYLWGFSTQKANYFEIRDSRSGDVASELLKQSKCEYLVSDVYSGYGKAVRDTNVERKKQNLPLIGNVYCNAHSRRKFKIAKDNFPDEAQFFVDRYGEIYHLEEKAKEKPPDEALLFRAQMMPYFESMRERALANIAAYPTKSSIGSAMGYFLKNYKELILFSSNAELPIDNNQQERSLRNPVVGRKTWYGTHSKRGALTAAILFTLVETCKLNGVNPREYFKKLVGDLHSGKPPYTPSDFKTGQSS